MSVTERRKFVLSNERLRQWVADAVSALSLGCVVTIEPPRRSLPQNALLHTLLTEAVAKGLSTDDGRRLTIEDAKTAFVTAWMIEEGHASDIIAFGGHPVQLRRSTADLDKDECGRLIESIYAGCAQRGIQLTETNK